MVEFRNWVTAAMAIGLALSVAACGGDGEEATELEQPKAPAIPVVREAPLRVDPAGEGEIRYSGETESGDTFKAQIGGDVTLPAEFGSDLPAFPDAVAQSAIETTGGTAIAAFESDADADDIVDFYREQLSAQGWSVEGVSDLGRGSLVTATKDGRRVMVNVEGMDEGSRFMLSVETGSQN